MIERNINKCQAPIQKQQKGVRDIPLSLSILNLLCPQISLEWANTEEGNTKTATTWSYFPIVLDSVPSSTLPRYMTYRQQEHHYFHLPPLLVAARQLSSLLRIKTTQGRRGDPGEEKEKRKENGGGIRGRTRMACPTMPGMYLVASGKDFCWIKVRIGRSSSVAKSASLFLGWEKKDTGVEWSTIPSLSFFPLPIIIFCRAAGILGLPRWLLHFFRSQKTNKTPVCWTFVTPVVVSSY